MESNSISDKRGIDNATAGKSFPAGCRGNKLIAGQIGLRDSIVEELSAIRTFLEQFAATIDTARTRRATNLAIIANRGR